MARILLATMNHRIFAALFLTSPLLIITAFPFPYVVPRWIFISILCVVWSIFLLAEHIKNKTSIRFSYLIGRSLCLWLLLAFPHSPALILQTASGALLNEVLAFHFGLFYSLAILA